MKREKSYFVCQECGYSNPKWMGKCPSCGAWNSMVEEKDLPKTSSLATPYKPPQPILSWVEDLPSRLTTGFSTLDEALGGGIVKGQVILLAGERPSLERAKIMRVKPKPITINTLVIVITAPVVIMFATHFSPALYMA